MPDNPLVIAATLLGYLRMEGLVCTRTLAANPRMATHVDPELLTLLYEDRACWHFPVALTAEQAAALVKAEFTATILTPLGGDVPWPGILHVPDANVTLADTAVAGVVYEQTDDDEGVIESVIEVSPGDLVNLYWDGGERIGLEVVAVDGDLKSVAGGTGNALPVAETAVTVDHAYHLWENIDSAHETCDTYTAADTGLTTKSLSWLSAWIRGLSGDEDADALGVVVEFHRSLFDFESLLEFSAAAGALLTLTLLAAPVAGVIDQIGQTGLRVNWSAVTTPAPAAGYLLQVATDAEFTQIVSGYDNLAVGDVTSHDIAGLEPATTYYARVRATSPVICDPPSLDADAVSPPSATMAATTHPETTETESALSSPLWQSSLRAGRRQ